MKKILLCMLTVLLCLTACTQKESATETAEEAVYLNITAQEAKALMDTQSGYVILDTRTQEEYEEGHIPGAVLIPHDQIRQQAEQLLTDKNQMILVYCRSGRRSKLAAEELVKLGYTDIREFGGILDWPYEVQ